jgi:hypothetical protein
MQMLYVFLGHTGLAMEGNVRRVGGILGEGGDSFLKSIVRMTGKDNICGDVRFHAADAQKVRIPTIR